MKKVELEVITLSHSMTQSHSYAVVLGEIDGPKRLPIVIGAFEAQSIAIALEKMTPTRPLTHDLMKNICVAMGIEIKEVLINNLEDGIFYAQLICHYGNETIEIDSRTSDALALALRFECPIFTYDTILESAGIEFEETGESIGQEKPLKAKKAAKSIENSKDLTQFSGKELNAMLKATLEKEEYEKAIAIRDELSKRKKDS